jgi:hypothetical protein
VAVARHQVHAGARDGGTQPPAVRERDHPVLVALPDGGARWPLPVQGEAPVPGERQVVVPPARDARAQRGPQAGGDVVGVGAGEYGLVGLDHQAAERLGHILAGHGAQRGRLAVEEGGQLGLAAQRRAELRDVLRTHARHPVQAGGQVGRDPGDRRRRQAAAGQGRGTGQRVRAAAGPARRDEAARAEVVQDRGGVLGRVHHPPSGPGRRPFVAGPGRQDDPQAALAGGLHGRRVEDQPAGRARVQDQRQPVGRAGHEEFDHPAVGTGDRAPFARVHHRRLDRPVRPQRGRHVQAVVAVGQPGEVLESAHG